MADVSIVPPFVVFQKPIFQFTPTEVSSSSSSSSGGGGSGTAAPPVQTPLKVVRVFFDEVANDVVIFGAASREVCFYHVQLLDPSREEEEVEKEQKREAAASQCDASISAVSDEEGERDLLQHHPSLPADAIALTVKYRQVEGEPLAIRHAKRCPTPLHSSRSSGNRGDRSSGGGCAYLVALSFDTRGVFLFLCHPRMGAQPMPAIAVFQCAPRSLRFRDNFYPIRAFYWTEELHSTACQQEANGQTTWHSNAHTAPHTLQKQQQQPQQEQQQQQGILHDDASALRTSATASTRRILLCVTAISIDVVGVEDALMLPHIAGEPSGGGYDQCVLLRRYTTHTDYWHYSPASRMFLSINRLKPCVVKMFMIHNEGLRTLPSVRLEDDWAAAGLQGNEAAQTPFYSTACMDTPLVHYPIGFLVLHRQLFLCCFSRRDWSALLFRYVCAESGSADGIFVKHAVLRAGIPMDVRREPIALQVVDNLIVLHELRRCVSSVFDVLGCEGKKHHPVQQHEQKRTRGQLGTAAAAAAAAAATTIPTTTAVETTGKGMRYSMESVASCCSNVSFRASTEREGLPTESWIARLANGLRNSSGGSSKARGGDDTNVPVLQPLLSAVLALHPPQQAGAAVAMDNDELYSHAFVFGTLPLLLDRRSGKVRLVGVNPFAVAATMPHSLERLSFYLHRTHCAGRAVQSMLHTMLANQECLGDVAHAFDLIASHNATHLLLLSLLNSEERPDIPSWMREPLCFGTTGAATAGGGTPRARVLLGSTAVLRRWLPLEDAEGPLPCKPPWRKWSGLTWQDVLAACTARPAVNTAGSGDFASVSVTDASIGQQEMLRDVFFPLADVVLVPHAAVGHNENEASATPFPTDVAGTGGASTGQVYFTRYLFYALLEYARCVTQTGSTLIDGLQSLLLRLLQSLPPGQGQLQQQQQQLLLRGIITDQVPTAMVLLQMGGASRQMGLDMLARLRADDLAAQMLLAERLPLEAGKYLYAGEERQNRQQQPHQSGRRVISSRIMNDILQCAMEAVLAGESDLKDDKTRRKALEFIAVYEMIANRVLWQPLDEEMLPQGFVSATVMYHQLLSKVESQI